MQRTFINNNKVHLVRNNLIPTRLYSTSNSVNLEVNIILTMYVAIN
jgi:hypothetical protein